MALHHSVARWGGIRIARRLGRAVPFIGTLVAVATVGYAIRRKGFLGGTVDTGLNAIPFVGTLKAIAETVRGRDYIADRPGR